jgi:hypothetical protein
VVRIEPEEAGPKDVFLDNLPLREPALEPAEVFLEPTHHHRLELLRAVDRHAATEPLRIQDLEERREAVRVPVVRCRGQEEPVLEPRGQLADRSGELGVDPVPSSQSRSGEAWSSSLSRWCETMKRECVAQGFTAKPRSWRMRRT